MRRIFACVGLAMLLAVAAAAQMPEDYLDILVARVKPERRADFDAICKKVADANRRNKGDTWVAMETTYGENNTVYFISTRHNYAAIETGSGAFMAAMN